MSSRQSIYQNGSFESIPEPLYESNFRDWEDSYGVGRSNEVEGFIGTEHRDIGDLASGKEPTTIAYGERGELLTFGEVVALAGDHFETYEEMRDLAKTPAGRANLAWARWYALDLKNQKVPEPNGDKKFVMERYYTLATRNFSHFSAGGTGFQTYTSWHGKAIGSALQAGEQNSEPIWRIALTKEAFGVHFLTDIFSASHVRMPRMAIHEWYSQNMPGDHLLRYMAKFLYDQLGKHDQLPLLARIFSGKAKDKIKNGIIELGGAAVRTLSVGDIVGVALHDLEGSRGLRVISEVNSDGQKVPGGFRWTAVGDGLLGKSADGSTTKMMATAAVITSLRDLERVRGVGRKISGSRLSGAQRADAVKKALGTPVFAAKAFVPREDPTPNANIPFPASSGKSPQQWRWGQLGDITYKVVDESVRKRMAGELFDILPSVKDARIRRALEAFVSHLRAEGIHVLEKAVGRKAR